VKSDVKFGQENNNFGILVVYEVCPKVSALIFLCMTWEGSTSLMYIGELVMTLAPCIYHPVQKVSDLRQGEKICVPGGPQFLIPFKVGPL
jgi:hypothetical protein